MAVKTCSKCGRRLKDTEFFKMKTGDRIDLCKDCLTQYIDNRDPKTFLWILEKFDVPYIASKWNEMTNKQYLKDPAKFGPKSVIGTYIRTMNMQQYREYTFSDSDMLNGKLDQQAEDTTPQLSEEEENTYEEQLRARLESGEISQAEYDTLTHTNADRSIGRAKQNIEVMPQVEQLTGNDILESLGAIPPTPTYSIDETYWTDQLTEDDIHYLMLKWGMMYTPQQWITMEGLYSKYANEYELNTDREDTLKKICKLSLKEDEALDAGDFLNAQKISSMLESARKSAKFTEAQKKEEEKTRTLDTIGQLVAICEREGGIIDNLPEFDPNIYPQDKIDFTLRDLKSYTYSLVSNELGLGELIESYIEKLESSEQEEVDVNDGLVTSAEEEAAETVTDEEAEQFHQFLENQVEEEAEELERMLGGGN